MPQQRRRMKLTKFKICLSYKTNLPPVCSDKGLNVTLWISLNRGFAYTTVIPLITHFRIMNIGYEHFSVELEMQEMQKNLENLKFFRLLCKLVSVIKFYVVIKGTVKEKWNGIGWKLITLALDRYSRIGKVISMDKDRLCIRRHFSSWKI